MDIGLGKFKGTKYIPGAISKPIRLQGQRRVRGGPASRAPPPPPALRTPAPRSPHGVEQGAVVLQPQQLVGRGHVVGNGFLPVVEECVRSPDFAGKQVVERQALHGPFKAEPFIFPALPEKHIYGVFLMQRKATKARLSRGSPRRGPRGAYPPRASGRAWTYHFRVGHRAEAGDIDVRPHLGDALCNRQGSRVGTALTDGRPCSLSGSLL